MNILHTILTFTFILFLGSTILLMPMARPTIDYTLAPNTEEIIIISIQNPRITIEALDTQGILLNISQPIIDSNSTTIYKNNIEILKSKTITFEQSGIYIFTFISINLNQISINFEGIFSNEIATIISILLINIVLAIYVYRRQQML